MPNIKDLQKQLAALKVKPAEKLTPEEVETAKKLEEEIATLEAEQSKGKAAEKAKPAEKKPVFKLSDELKKEKLPDGASAAFGKVAEKANEDVTIISFKKYEGNYTVVYATKIDCRKVTV